jgi:hypothetical protein
MRIQIGLFQVCGATKRVASEGLVYDLPELLSMKAAWKETWQSLDRVQRKRVSASSAREASEVLRRAQPSLYRQLTLTGQDGISDEMAAERIERRCDARIAIVPGYAEDDPFLF